MLVSAFPGNINVYIVINLSILKLRSGLLMKQLLLFVAFACISCSCNNNNRQTGDEKLKEAILVYHTSGTAGTDTSAIDSISIQYVDTLSLKKSVKIALDRNNRTLKLQTAVYESNIAQIGVDTLLLVTLRLQKSLYTKAVLKYDSTNFIEQKNKLAADSLQLMGSYHTMQNTRKAIDSLQSVYAAADSLALFEFYVGATIYHRGADHEQGVYTISKNWKVRMKN